MAASGLGLVAWSVGCSVYGEALLSPGQGGGGAGGATPTHVEGGGPSGQAGVTNHGGTGGAEVGGGPSSNPGGAGGGGLESAGGEGGRGSIEDECPDDPDKIVAGSCGCGVPEICADLKAGLLHRYSFEVEGSVAVDSVGDADAPIVGTSASGGQLTLDGTTEAYVDLPNGLMSTLLDASFEIWLSWNGGDPWQRIFDFGSNDAGEGNRGVGLTYLYLTPSEGSATGALRASFTSNGLNAETTVKAPAALPSGTLQHLVVVVDDTNDQLRLYSNGALVALTGLLGHLADLEDTNNWVGRSNYLNDDPLGGTVDELRIYGVALTDAQVAASASFGPNPSFL